MVLYNIVLPIEFQTIAPLHVRLYFEIVVIQNGTCKVFLCVVRMNLIIDIEKSTKITRN